MHFVTTTLPLSYRRLRKAYNKLQVMNYLLCIINSSSSLTFETTNLKKPAGNEHHDMRQIQGDPASEACSADPGAHTVWKHMPGLLV